MLRNPYLQRTITACLMRYSTRSRIFEEKVYSALKPILWATEWEGFLRVGIMNVRCLAGEGEGFLYTSNTLYLVIRADMNSEDIESLSFGRDSSVI